MSHVHIHAPHELSEPPEPDAQAEEQKPSGGERWLEFGAVILLSLATQETGEVTCLTLHDEAERLPFLFVPLSTFETFFDLLGELPTRRLLESCIVVLLYGETLVD